MAGRETTMTEKEKMLGGCLYHADLDATLVAERNRAKDLCLEYNRLPSSEAEKGRAMLLRLFGKAKGRFSIAAPFYCDYGYNIEIGENFYANHNCVILDCAPVVFGDDVLVGPNCCFSAAGHPLDVELRKAGLEFARPIVVGDCVWFGAGVIVLPGVRIGDGSVVGAGSVVTRDVPSGVVAVGNPCRVLRGITARDKMS